MTNNFCINKKTSSKDIEYELRSYINLLSDEQKMKFWIKTLLSVYNNIPEIIKAVDKVIEVQASSLSFASNVFCKEKSTFSQVEKVIDLTERKNNLLNIYLISKNLFACVDEEDRLFLKRKYIYSWTADELAIEYEISLRTVFRRCEKLINKIYEATKRKNWSLKFINLQVKNETWLSERYRKIIQDYFQTTKNHDNGLEL